MGGSSSSQKQKPVTPLKSEQSGLIMLGPTMKGPIIMNFTPGHLDSIRPSTRFPKYAHAFVNLSGIGYITGGVEELESTSQELKSFQQQEYEGVISKRFYQVNLSQVLSQPDSAFKNKPDMINARYAHCAIEHQSEVYVLGGREYGDDEVGILSACQKFVPVEEKWMSLPSLQHPRAGASAIVYGDLIYVFGGFNAKYERIRVIESYLDGQPGWKRLPYKLHEGLEGFLMIPNPTSSSSIFIFGGKTNTGKTNSVVEIDFDKSTVQHLKSMSEPRCYHKGFVKDKTAYIIGGGADSVESYDISTNLSILDKQLSFLEHCTSKQLSALSSLQLQVKLTQKSKPYQSPNYKNKAFIFGHSQQPFAKIINLDNFVVVSESQSLYHNFYKFPTVAKVNKETCFVMGGINADLTQVTDAVYSFNLLTEEIKYLEPMKSAKYGFSAAVKGSYLYIVGGRKLGGDDVAILGSCERFSFETYTWESIAPLKHKRHSSLLLVSGNVLLTLGGYKGNGIRSNEIEIYIEAQNRWVQVQQKFELAAESMTPVFYVSQVYLFGGRAENIDIQKVFKFTVETVENKKHEKCIKTNLEHVGNLSAPGTNLKVHIDKNQGMAYIFGNVKGAIDVYDMKNHKIVSTEKLPVFDYLEDALFQTYTIIF